MKAARLKLCDFMYVTFWKIVGRENWSVIVEVGGGMDIKGHEGILGGMMELVGILGVMVDHHDCMCVLVKKHRTVH